MGYKIEMHCHTSEVSGCASVSAEALVQHYKENGYDGVVITNHCYHWFFDNISGNWKEKATAYLNGFRKAKSEGDKIGVAVYLGLEMGGLCDYGGDYLTYGVTEELFFNNQQFFGKNGVRLQDYYKFIKENNGVVYRAHPFRAGEWELDGLHIDGIEVYNASDRYNRDDNSNILAQEYCNKNKILQVSGSDFHHLSNHTSGGIVFNSLPADEIKMANMLKNGDFVSLMIM